MNEDAKEKYKHLQLRSASPRQNHVYFILLSKTAIDTNFKSTVFLEAPTHILLERLDCAMMAEASEELKNREMNVQLGFPEETISTLILTSYWHADTYGMATVTKCLINDLRLTDPEAAKINITCALLEEEGKISANDIDEAGKLHVQLRGAKRPKGDNKNKEPNIKWLDKYAVTYYSYLLLERNYDFVIGHMPYLANGICNLKEFGSSLGQFPKVVLFVHALPKTSEGEVDRDVLNNSVKAADIIFSVGRAACAEINPYIETSDPRFHGMYISNVPIELFTTEQENRKCTGKQVITLMMNDYKNLDVTGLHYELGMAAAVKAADSIISWDGYDPRKQIRMEFLLLGANRSERKLWKKKFEDIKEKQPEKKKNMTFRHDVIKKTTDMQHFMKKTAVLLLPLKPNSPLFGVEALAAAAAGTPFLVSSVSGIASLLQDIEEYGRVIFDEGNLTVDSLFWKRRIIDMIEKPECVKSQSERIKQKLIQDTTIASSHLAFVRTIAEKACIQLTIDIHFNSKSTISEQSFEIARGLGICPGEKDKENVQAFVTAFLLKLLHQKEKIHIGLLDKELPASVKESWQKVLSFLEGNRRKVLDLREGSLNFILFCPTEASYRELKNQQWQNEFQKALLVLHKETVPTIELTILATNPHIISSYGPLPQTIKETT